MIRRFLRARDLDVEKASALFLKYLAWKRSFLPKGYIPETEIANDLSHKKVCLQGHDKIGRPIVVIFGNRHNPSKGSPEEFKRESPLLSKIFLTFSIHNLTFYHLLQCFWDRFCSLHTGEDMRKVIIINRFYIFKWLLNQIMTLMHIIFFHLRMPRGEEKFIAIADIQGWGYSNCDIRGYIAALFTLQVLTYSAYHF